MKNKHLEKFNEVAKSLNNTFIEEWKKKGGKVVGYSCTFLPHEVLHAAGLLPVRLRGIGTTSLSIGDTYFGPVNCSVPKCFIQVAGQGDYKFLDGAVVGNGCDSMRRLYDTWRKANEDFPGVLPRFFEYVPVPHRANDYSIDFYAEEIKDFIKKLEAHFGVKVTDQKLRDSIKVYNESRLLLQKLEALRSSKEIPISGADAMAVLIAGKVIPPEQYNTMLKELIADLEKAPSVSDGQKRIMLVGSANDDVDFIHLIEENGAIVVADTVCYGSRSFSELVDEKGDPVHALASTYLKNNICPRMYGIYKDRFAYISKLAEKTSVQGVILQNVRFCDLHGSENSVIERDLEAKGIPCMKLEREYGPLMETGRIRLRVDALLERIE
jgi:bzd-type benzoyl-CoA reductase N subunit